ncbi:conserved hypothetical protein [Burkholderia cepacia]|nr:conserved hypothetical protein [Burkholderia cepacia]
MRCAGASRAPRLGDFDVRHHGIRRLPRRRTRAAVRRRPRAAHRRAGARHLHGSARHVDRERRGADHLGQPRRRDERRHLGDLVVLGRVRDRGAAYRLARAARRRGAPVHAVGARVHDRVGAVRPGDQLRDADRVPAAAGPRVGADGAAVADDPDAQLPAREARARTRVMGDDGDRRADLRPAAGRLDQRQLHVAVDLLHQPADRHLLGDLRVFPAARPRDEDDEAADRRDRPRAARDRRVVPADDARPRQGPRLVQLDVHRRARADRGRVARVHARVGGDREGTGGRPVALQGPQLRARRDDHLVRLHGVLRLGRDLPAVAANGDGLHGGQGRPRDRAGRAARARAVAADRPQHAPARPADGRELRVHRVRRRVDLELDVYARRAVQPCDPAASRAGDRRRVLLRADDDDHAVEHLRRAARERVGAVELPAHAVGRDRHRGQLDVLGERRDLPPRAAVGIGERVCAEHDRLPGRAVAARHRRPDGQRAAQPARHAAGLHDGDQRLLPAVGLHVRRARGARVDHEAEEGGGAGDGALKSVGLSAEGLALLDLHD